VYTWAVEERAGGRVVAEKRSGFRVQDNVHVKASDEANARAALNAAYGVEGVELLVVDDWSSELRERRQDAQKQALAEARRKSDLLLSVFETRPPPINVHESTVVVFPKDLYATFQRAQWVPGHYSGPDLPRLPALQPLNTYYRGLYEDVDVMDSTMPFRPQISVICTVAIYYAAPLRPAIPPPTGK
jgi:hypothetical protein